MSKDRKDRRRTTTHLVIHELERAGPASFDDLLLIIGDSYNRVHAAVYWLERCGAIRRKRSGRYVSTPGRDARHHTIALIVRNIRRSRS